MNFLPLKLKMLCYHLLYVYVILCRKRFLTMLDDQPLRLVCMDIMELYLLSKLFIHMYTIVSGFFHE